MWLCKHTWLDMLAPTQQTGHLVAMLLQCCHMVEIIRQHSVPMLVLPATLGRTQKKICDFRIQRRIISDNKLQAKKHTKT